MGARAGLSLVELLIVLVLIGILTGLATPSFIAHAERLRVRAALDLFTADLYRARALAARGGRGVVLRFDPARRDTCLRGYAMELVGDPPRQLRTVRFADVAPGVCVTVNVGAPMRVTPRGLLLGAARTARAVLHAQRDSATVSIAGRVYRSY